jgi:hypothetical protein
MCGCGEPAPVASRTFSKRGIFKGEAMMYLPNHHGRTHRHTRTPTYRSWEAMWRRCTVPQSPDYANYGGRGITIDAAWKDFAAFLRDMGERPLGHSLDRVDNDGDYGPGNCRWATPAQQLRNRRGVRLSMEAARDIRHRHAQGGITQRSLAKEYGVRASLVSRVLSNSIWREDGQ